MRKFVFKICSIVLLSIVVSGAIFAQDSNQKSNQNESFTIVADGDFYFPIGEMGQHVIYGAGGMFAVEIPFKKQSINQLNYGASVLLNVNGMFVNDLRLNFGWETSLLGGLFVRVPFAKYFLFVPSINYGLNIKGFSVHDQSLKLKPIYADQMLMVIAGLRYAFSSAVQLDFAPYYAFIPQNKDGKFAGVNEIGAKVGLAFAVNQKEKVEKPVAEQPVEKTVEEKPVESEQKVVEQPKVTEPEKPTEPVNEEPKLSAEEEKRLAEERWLAEQRAILRAKKVQKTQEMVQSFKLADVSIKQNELGFVISLDKIKFQANSTNLEQSEIRKLTKIIQILNTYTNDVLVIGHCADDGNSSNNDEISLARAKTVENYIVANKCRTTEHISSQGRGASEPVATNATAEGRAKNRRVELVLLDSDDEKAELERLLEEYHATHK